MAALMRLSRGVNLTHLRRFICNSTQQNVLRPLPQSPVTTQKYNITRTPWFITRHLTSATSISESLLMERKQDDQTENITTDRKQTSSRWEPIEEKFNHLDSLIRRSSCLNEQYVFSILNTAEKRVGSLTYQQAVSLIRSTGALLYKEDPASRRAIFADVWKRVEKLVDKLDIVHHNVALKIRLENEEQLDPSKEIENLESLGIEPNRVTFQIMIEAYCLQGNLSGAMTILKHMKENGLHVNENVFHSLMIGKVKNGDFEGAKEVLANMSEAGLLPMAQSYLPLLNGYAEKGDFQGINQTLSELESEDIRCQSRHFFDIIVTLAEHGHGDIIPKVLQEAQERLGHRSPFNQEALNCSYKLTALGKDDDALKIFLGIVDLPDESYKQRIATYFLEAMAQNNRPIEVVSSVAATLKNAGYLTSVPWQNIADTAAKKGHIDSAIDFYKKVVEVGDEVDRRPLSFVFSSKLNQGDYDGLFKVVGEISKLLAHSRLLAYDIYMSAVLELLKSMPEEDIFAKFKENGVTQTHIEEMRFLGYVDAGKFDEAVNARNSIPSFGLVPHFLSRGFMVNRDTDGLTKLFKIMKLKIINQSYLASLATNTLSRIIKRKQLTLEESRDLVKAFIKNRLMVNISSSDTDSLIQILLDKGFSIEETNSIKDSFHDVEVTQSSRQLSSAQIAALSEQLEKDPESVSETTRNRVEMSLLKQYCRNGDVDKVEELKQRLEDRGFLFRNSSLYDLAIFYAKHRKDLEMAVTYKERMLTDQLKISPLLNLSIAILHVEQGNIDAAIKELENVEKRDSRLAFEQVKTSENLLKACADTATPSATRQMLGTLLDLGYLPYATNGALKTVLNTYLTNSADQDEIVSMIEEIVTKHKKVSGFRSVLLHFIEKEDASRLQKVVDILSTVKDESEILHHLALLFIESGKLRQAARILETPGLRAQMKVLQEGCDYLVNTGKEQSLERLVDLTKELANINRDEMLFSLIRFYARRNDSLKKALDVLTRYEEEGIRPSGRTLRYLAKALKQNDMDVPFDVPEFVQPIPKRAVKEESPHDVGYTGINKDIIDALSTGNITVALDLRKSEGVKADILAEGVKLLRKLKKGEVIRDLLTTLGDQGDVDTLQHLRFNVIRNQENLLHRQLFRAYVNSERTEEFLDFVNGNLGTLYKYMDVPNIRLLVEKKPHLFDKFEALVHSFQAANDKFYCANVLFNYFLLGRQEQKAQELFEKYPDMKATLHVPFLCSQAVENQNENVLQTVEKAIDGVDKWQNILKSSKIQYKCKTGDLQGATDLFEQCEKDGMMLQNFGIKTLEAFSELLTSNNQPIPWKTEELDAMKEEIRQRAATRSSRRNSPRQQTNENDDINSPEK